MINTINHTVWLGQDQNWIRTNDKRKLFLELVSRVNYQLKLLFWLTVSNYGCSSLVSSRNFFFLYLSFILKIYVTKSLVKQREMVENFVTQRYYKHQPHGINVLTVYSTCSHCIKQNLSNSNFSAKMLYIYIYMIVWKDDYVRKTKFRYCIFHTVVKGLETLFN